MSRIDDEVGEPLFHEISDSDAVTARDSSAKRKRGGDEDQKNGNKVAKKRKKVKGLKVVEEGTIDSQLGVNFAIARMDGKLMADYIAQRTKRFQPDLSLVEVEDIHIPEQAIVDTSGWKRSRTMDELPDFLEHFCVLRGEKKEELMRAPNEKGSPHTLVIAGAGLRSANLTRALRKFQTKESLVAKLFAKHIKLKEAVEMVKNTRMGIGIGTPQRIMDLLDDGMLEYSSLSKCVRGLTAAGALSSKHLQRIVVDASHIDLKKRGILDMRETQQPLVRLLSRPDLKGRYRDAQSRVDLLFF